MSEMKRDYTEAELAEMSRDEKVRLGLALDDVELVEYRERWPVRGTRAERRAERWVASWFVLATLSALAFIAVFIFWPWEYVDPLKDPRGHFIYSLYNPLIGLFLGLSILSVGIGIARRLLISRAVGVSIGVFGLGRDVFETALLFRESERSTEKSLNAPLTRTATANPMILIRPRTGGEPVRHAGREHYGDHVAFWWERES